MYLGNSQKNTLPYLKRFVYIVMFFILVVFAAAVDLEVAVFMCSYLDQKRLYK